MSNNVLERLAQMSTPEVKRANWNWSHTNVGTNDFGFLKVRLCHYVSANSNYRLDFRSAYSSNPTISPVLSKAKVRVTAIWVPISLYVPALRDNIAIKPGDTDFSLPSLTFNYTRMGSSYNEKVQTLNQDQIASAPIGSLTAEERSTYFAVKYGSTFPYVPRGSVFAELGMWAGDYQPLNFSDPVVELTDSFPSHRNAIPFLGYLDFFRTYIANSQQEYFPLRFSGFKPGYSYVSRVLTDNGWEDVTYNIPASPAEDYMWSRSELDNFFTSVRKRGLNYPTGSGSFVINDLLPLYSVHNFGFPLKTVSNSFVYDTDLREEMQSFVDRNPPVFYSDNHYFELRDTYKNDYFTAFLSNENVEYERSTARVQTDSEGVITMEQIYSAQRVQNYIRRSVFKNNGYSDFIESQFDITPPTNLTHPMFLGSVSTDLYWNDVISQTQSGDDNSIESNLNLGSRAGLGFGRMVTGSYRGNGDRPFVSFTAKEPGYIMLIESIVPDVSYFRTYDPIYDQTSLESIYYPAFDKDGYQDKQFIHLCETPFEFNDKIQVMDYNDYNVAYAQEPAYFELMSKPNRMSGQISEESVYRHWVFSRQNYLPPFVGISQFFGPFVEKMSSVYVDPEQFNTIFANINGLDNFQCFYDFDVKVYQPLSHRFLSFK